MLTNYDILSIVLGVKKDCQNLSSVERRVPHVALTHFCRANWYRRPGMLNAILAKCRVEPYMGALPPELRARVPRESLGETTYRFRMILEDFLIANIGEMRDSKEGPIYNLAEIGQLFDTKCILEIGTVNFMGCRIWSGFAGIVGKMSFPEIKAQYALKLFDDRIYGGGHGALCEVPTAFAASHAEPRDNARIYMASLIYEPYLLSRWEGDVVDGRIRENKNAIFVTSVREAVSRNYRKGRRIDFGETYRTAYGAAGYRVRKMYRKIKNAMENQQMSEIRDSLRGKCAGFSASEVIAAMELVQMEATVAERVLLARGSRHLR